MRGSKLYALKSLKFLYYTIFLNEYATAQTSIVITINNSKISKVWQHLIWYWREIQMFRNMEWIVDMLCNDSSLAWRQAQVQQFIYYGLLERLYCSIFHVILCFSLLRRKMLLLMSLNCHILQLKLSSVCWWHHCPHHRNIPTFHCLLSRNSVCHFLCQVSR